ncbi:MAG: Holliday junction branch migration DNA helicase RuvB [Elusimicrobiota bacterium]|jgi:Holliday junction DNA helicase RuvB|nr:Holliday junction branch migration DNA helicase RuvB [Elusimicrobiota bacterium]
MNKDNRILEAAKIMEEEKVENSLRPQTLNDFVGQNKLKANLKVFIEAAKKRKEALDHCLFYAPPGLGKTTLSHIIAKEMGVGLTMTSGPALNQKADLATLLTNLNEGDVFFIDEIHRMPHMIEEYIYPAMEDFKLDVIIGQGPSAKIVKLPLPHFTLIGATTRAGLLSSPLRDRFGIIGHLDFYDVSELVIIVRRSSSIMNVVIDEDAVMEIALRSRGTPRIVNRLLKRVRDFADIDEGKITKAVAKKALNALEVDDAGLDKMDRLLLNVIVDKFKGGPVGVETLAIAISEDVDTITDVYEPYLIQSGFIARTPRGRVVTEMGYKHLGKNYPKKFQSELIQEN